MTEQLPVDCNIREVGKQRNGRARYWCIAHKAPATGRYGVKLTQCESAYLYRPHNKVLPLKPSEYPGGIAIWGAVKPVYDTTRLPPESGVHVHARRVAGPDKDIDDTFDAVEVPYRRNLLEDGRMLITSEAAVNYYVSRFLKRDIQHLYCVRCGELHLDAGYFATHPHRKHLCHGCGELFTAPTRSVSNPVALLRELHRDTDASRRLRRAKKAIKFRQQDYRGGIRIWASNPALLWTAGKPEEEGIHLHVYDGKSDVPVQDDTFADVVIDGVRLDETMIKYYMAQAALPYLAKKVVSLACPSCGEAHLDTGEEAFEPHKLHTCHSCNHQFSTPGRPKLVVSNPFVAVAEQLLAYVPKQ